MNLSTDILNAVDARYTGLATSDCCLSCGGALEHAAPQPGEIALDLGSGRGNDVLRLAEAVGATGYAYGIDASVGMLAKARRTAEKLGIANASFVASDFEALDLPDTLADLVISNCAINHALDKEATWAEIFRVLKPGGRFVVSDIYALDEVPEAFRTDPAAVAECWAGSVTRDVYMNTLHRAGFTDVRVLEESAPYPKGAIQVASVTLAGRRPSVSPS